MRAQPAVAALASPRPPLPQRDQPKGPKGNNREENFTGPLSAPRLKRSLATPKSCGIFWKKSRGIVESKSTSMPKADHERDLSARALFFKNEVRNFVHLYGPEMIIFVGGDESKLRDLVRWWEEKTGIWMDAWAAEREFLVDDADDADADNAELQPADAAQADKPEAD